MDRSHDAAQQTRIDMTNARAKTTVDVTQIRKFLYGAALKAGEPSSVQTLFLDTLDEWQKRRCIVQILEKDPTFSKEMRSVIQRYQSWRSHVIIHREFMTRSERYRKGMAMTDRIYELQDLHGWSAEEVSIAFASLDDALPIILHEKGTSNPYNQYSTFPYTFCKI